MRIKSLWQRPFLVSAYYYCALYFPAQWYFELFKTVWDKLTYSGLICITKYAVLMHRDKKFRIFQAKCSHYPIRHIPCFRFVVFLPGLFNSRSIALYFIHQTSCNWCLCFTTLDFKVKLYCGVKKLSLIIRESLLESHIASLVCRLFCFCFCFFFCFVL